MSILKNTVIVSFATLVSRILGYLRDFLMAYVFGTGPVAEAFIVALKLPNLFRKLFAEGAFSASFVPIFSEKFSKEGREKALVFANSSFTLLFLFLSAFTVLILVNLDTTINIIAYGFNAHEYQFNLAISLSKITFIYLLSISLVSLCSGVLNTLNDYGTSAISPVILNICMISAFILAFKVDAETAAYYVSYGVATASLLQFLFVYMRLKKYNYLLKLTKPKIDGDIKLLLRNMLPVLFGAGVSQINMLVDVNMASFFDKAVAYITYSDRIVQLPMALIGTAIGTVLLPALSKAYAKENNFTEVCKFQDQAVSFCLILAMPATVALLIVPEIIVNLLFERGAFIAQDTYNVAKTIQINALALPAFILLKIFITPFYANKNTKSPLIFAVISLVVNIIGNLVLMKYFGYLGIVLATSISAWINLILLIIYSVKYKYYKMMQINFLLNLIKIIAASLLISIILLFYNKYYNEFLLTQHGILKLSSFIIITIICVVCYFSLIIFSKVLSFKQIISSMKRK